MVYDLLSNNRIELTQESLSSLFDLILIIIQQLKGNWQDRLGQCDTLLVVHILKVIK